MPARGGRTAQRQGRPRGAGKGRPPVQCPYDLGLPPDPVDDIPTDGELSDERIAQLLRLQAESDQLDYKEKIGLNGRDLVELAKDVGAMGVRGGHILGGVDDGGRLSGQMDEVDRRLFDEASLRSKLRKYLPDSARLRSRVLERDGHVIVAIYVEPNSQGCSIFVGPGQYQDGRNMKTVFSPGDIFWRDGTSSTRISPEGLEAVIEQRVAGRKEEWMEEQQELRRRDREELERNTQARQLGQGPLGSVNLDLPADELTRAVLDLVRTGDRIALLHLLNEGARRGQGKASAGEVDDVLLDALDKLTCLAAAFLEYEQDEWLRRVIEVLSAVYSAAFRGRDSQWYGYQGVLSKDDPAPRIWLGIMERVFALGALAVRRRNWSAVRLLSSQLPEALVEAGYKTNWFRHAVTMASRATHLHQQDPENPGTIVNLISLARKRAVRLACLRSDGVGPDDEALLTSVSQFDLLANVVAAGEARSTDRRVIYPSFARLRQTRIQPIADRLIDDPPMREQLFPLGDDDLAIALREIGERAASEGWASDGFEGWNGTPTGEFITTHHPPELEA